jgi:copper homeostasis protein
MTSILLEACVDSVAGAVAAQTGGAQRVELCAGLLEGGVTPSAATVELTRQHIDIGLNVMIRPRGGDFHYSPLEFEVMLKDIAVAKSLGADGVVVGILEPNGSIDTARTAQLIAAARPMSVTFHRAFDMVADHQSALENLIQLGVHRILTSGLEASAVEGADIIAQLVKQAAGRITIMAGGGVTERNVARIVQITGVREIHMSARRVAESAMVYRNQWVHLGSALYPPEFSHQVTSSDRIRAGRRAITEAGF